MFMRIADHFLDMAAQMVATRFNKINFFRFLVVSRKCLMIVVVIRRILVYPSTALNE